MLSLVDGVSLVCGELSEGHGCLSPAKVGRSGLYPISPLMARPSRCACMLEPQYLSEAVRWWYDMSAWLFRKEGGQGDHHRLSATLPT